MNLRVHWLVILLALALAWPLRTRAGAGNVVEPGELYGVAALYSDGESCLHARRVACALEGAGVGSRDGLLGHPDPAEIVAPPLYDAARTALVQLRVAPGDELGLQRFLGGLGPWTGVLVCFLAWLAASAAGAGLVESLLAALWIAVAPACVRSSEWGRISDVALGLVPLALAVRFSTRALASEEPLRAILGGLSSGAFAGLLLACSPAGCVPFVAGVAGFALWTWRASGETARFAARAGLLYCLVAALVARMLVLDGPWQAEPGGLFAAWVEAASNLAFACGAPFLIAVAREQAAAKRVFPLLVMLAACVVIGLLILRSLAPIGRVWTAWAQARELRPLFGAQGRREILLALTPLCLFLPAGWLALARRRLDPAGLYLLVFSAGMLLATLVDPELCALVRSGERALARAQRDRMGERQPAAALDVEHRRCGAGRARARGPARAARHGAARDARRDRARPALDARPHALARTVECAARAAGLGCAERARARSRDRLGGEKAGGVQRSGGVRQPRLAAHGFESPARGGVRALDALLRCSLPRDDLVRRGAHDRSELGTAARLFVPAHGRSCGPRAHRCRRARHLHLGTPAAQARGRGPADASALSTR